MAVTNGCNGCMAVGNDDGAEGNRGALRMFKAVELILLVVW